MGKSTWWVAVVATLALAGSDRASAEPRAHVVVMQNMRFGPIPAGIKAGDTILWVNRDVVPHTVTARDRSFDLILAAGRSGRTVVRAPGTIAFYCRYHPAMRSVLVADGGE